MERGACEKRVAASEPSAATVRAYLAHVGPGRVLARDEADVDHAIGLGRIEDDGVGNPPPAGGR